MAWAFSHYAMTSSKGSIKSEKKDTDGATRIYKSEEVDQIL